MTTTTKYEWIEITEDRYEEMLGVLPPALWLADGFLVGEPMDHNEHGQPRYSAFLRFGGKHYECEQVLTAREFRAVSPMQQFA